MAYTNFAEMVKEKSEDLKNSAAVETVEGGTQQVKELGNGRYETADGVQLKLAETKSKRCQFLLYPSLHAAAKSLADATGCSLNDLINTALSDYVKTHK